MRIEIGEHLLTGDEPVAAGGGGLGPGPFDLMTAALAECTAMTIRWFARQRNWPLDHLEVTVDHAKKLALCASVPTHVFDKVILIRGSELTDEQRTHLIDVASKCPVQRILEGTTSINTRMGAKLDEYFDQ